MTDASQRKKFNSKNERLKYAYRMYLSGIKHKDKKTWLDALKHIRYYEVARGFQNFVPISDKYINDYVNKLNTSGKSLSYMRQNLKALVDFYTWLERQKGYRGRINLDKIEMFGLTNNQRKTASSTECKESYLMDDVFRAIRAMPAKTYIDHRNRAIISLQALCGMRIGELRTVKLKNLKYDNIAENWFIFVFPKNMAVKFAKTRHAYFMPWDDDIRDNVLRWAETLRGLGWTDNAPLFPSLYDNFGQSDLLQMVHTPSEIKSNTTILNLFRKIFTNAGLPYYRPHSFRDSFSIYGQFPLARIGFIMNK